MPMNDEWVRIEPSKKIKDMTQKELAEFERREERKYFNSLVRLEILEKTPDGGYKEGKGYRVKS
jgi:hypothetical protein